jgi:Flp pilus assembly protein TadG
MSVMYTRQLPGAALRRDERGSVAIIFAMIAVPAVAIAGGALDIGTALKAKIQLQQASDAAALAGASLPEEATTAERIATAEAFFAANAGTTGITPSVSVNGRTVAVSAARSVPTTFLKLAHVPSLSVAASGTATPNFENVNNNGPENGKACILALDPNSDDGIHIQGDNDISMLGCWAHTNSTKPTAINANGSQAMATGTGFCAVGGHVTPHDNFQPAPTTSCAVTPDPFATVGAYETAAYTPTYEALTLPTNCVANNLSLRKGTFTLQPGRYCGGIEMRAHARVTMQPGIYYIDNGQFLTQSGTNITGNNVLIYLVGANSTMTVIGGGTVNLTGRNTGSSHAGFLVIQHPDAARMGQSNIQGGGTFNLEGVIYMPTQRIEVAGQGDVNGNSRYFGMIAKDFYFRGNGQFHTKVHTAGAPMPDLMPVLPKVSRVQSVSVR